MFDGDDYHFFMHDNQRTMHVFMKALSGVPGLSWGLLKPERAPDSSAIGFQHSLGGSRSSVVGGHESERFVHSRVRVNLLWSYRDICDVHTM